MTVHVRTGRGWLPICVGFACLILQGGAAAAGQSPAAREYVALIERYLSGDTRAAAEALGERDDRWIESAQSAVLRDAATWPRNQVGAAVLLHTDVVVDGWVLPHHVPAHLNAARRFLDLSRGTLVSPQFRHDWLLAVAWHLQSQMELGAVLPWLDDLTRRYPDDAEVLLTTGIFYETVGWSAELPLDLPWNGGSRTLGALPHKNQHDALEAAATAYRHAATFPDTHTQATLRLGRVLTELDRADAGRRLLRPLVQEAPDRRWRYLAALFTAAADTRLGNSAAAASAYAQAEELMPGCQTPLVGLTAVRRLQGDAAEAAALAGRLTRLVTACDDPWWFYRFGQPPERLPLLVGDMRRSLAP